jgi:hypothetical protein
MGNVNTIPVVSQIKSAMEAIKGNLDAASETQEEFSKKCIIVSQVRSAVEACCGDFDAATKTQIEFASQIDAVPVLSQIKSAVQAGIGDHQEALETQEKFSKRCIVVSQVRSAVEACCGDFDAATKTQIEFASRIDAVPVLSQIKSAVQAGIGDHKAALETQENFLREFLIVLHPVIALIRLTQDGRIADPLNTSLLRSWSGAVPEELLIAILRLAGAAALASVEKEVFEISGDLISLLKCILKVYEKINNEGEEFGMEE